MTDDHNQFEGEKFQWIADLHQVSSSAGTRFDALLGRHFMAEKHLDLKLMHLVWVAVDAVATHLFPLGLSIHADAVLAEGGTPEELVEALEIAASLADRSMGALPIIFAAAKSAGVSTPDIDRSLTDAEQALKDRLIDRHGHCPDWFELAVRAMPEFVEAHLAIAYLKTEYALSPFDRALIFFGVYSCPAAYDANEMRIHAERALSLGATTEQLLAVVQLASGICLHAFTIGAPEILQALPQS